MRHSSSVLKSSRKSTERILRENSERERKRIIFAFYYTLLNRYNKTMNTIIQQNQEKKKIVILGAGFGGLRAAAQIGKAIMAHKLEDKYEVVIVERNDHHTYTPLLYEVATTLADTVTAPRLHEVATFNIKSIFARLSVTPLRDNIMGIDLEKSVIQLELGGALIFDHLIITLGSETNDFGIPGLHEHSLPLKTFGDAIRIRDRIADLMTSGEKDVDQI